MKSVISHISQISMCDFPKICRMFLDSNVVNKKILGKLKCNIISIMLWFYNMKPNCIPPIFTTCFQELFNNY